MLTYTVFDEMMDLRNLIDGFFNERTDSRKDYPYAAVYEGTDDLEIRMVIPGVKPEEISIHLVDNSLVIEGEKKSDVTEDRYLRRERTFGKFSRNMALPFRVNPEKIEAELKDGILKVRLYKSEDAKPRKIAIN